MPVEVPLSRGLVALIDEADADRVLRHRWHAIPGNGGHIYARSADRGVLPDRMHRWLLTAPEGLDVHHVDNDGLNNQRANLRICSRSQNIANRLSKNRFGFRGVQLVCPGSYKAAITHNYRTKHIGCFPTPDLAARAYDAAARELFGEFARLNFPDAKIFADALTKSSQPVIQR